MPLAAERAAAQMRELGLADRCETVGGDFFKAVPGGADAYLLKARHPRLERGARR